MEVVLVHIYLYVSVCLCVWGGGISRYVEVCGCAEIHTERTLGHRGGVLGCVVWRCWICVEVRVLVCMRRWW